MTDYRAKPEQWAETEQWAKHGDNSDACILELRARVEALEANYKPTSNPSQIRGSLLHRVADAIAKEDWMNSGLDESACQCDDPTYRYTSRGIDAGLGVGSLQARAAIREVAAWLRETHSWTVGPAVLEQEAEI